MSAFDLDDFDWAPPVETPARVETSLPPDEPVELSELRLSPKMATLVRDGFTEGNGYRSRSEADAAVVAAMVAAGHDDATIRGVFERFPIGSKFREKGRDGPRYLARTMSFVRSKPDERAAPASPASAAGLAEGVEYLDLATLARDGIPPVDWLLEGWIAHRDVALLAGAGGIGKSTTAAALAVGAATGRDWCGIGFSEPLRALYVDEEQDVATCARLFIRLGAPVENLRVACGQGIRLDSQTGVARLEAAIAEWGARLVVIDSVQQVFGAAKENDATEIGAVYRELFGMRDRHGVAFLLTHHKRKAQPGVGAEALEMVRGSTAHGTQASTVWYAYAPGPGRLNLVQAKRRGGTKTSLAIAYHADDPDGLIELSGEGGVEDQETALERVSEWLITYLSEHGTSKREAIVAAAIEAKHAEATVGRALVHAHKLGAIERPVRGYYRIPAPADRDVIEGDRNDELDRNLIELDRKEELF